MLEASPYGLVLFEHETGDAAAVNLLTQFLHSAASVPFIVLTEDADERKIAEVIQGESWNCLTKSQLDGATLIRTIRSTMAMHRLQQEHHSAELSLRKLSHAVEQSADAVVVTNRDGIIEYVNPSFEALTGYTQAEVCGKTP